MPPTLTGTTGATIKGTKTRTHTFGAKMIRTNFHTFGATLRTVTPTFIGQLTAAELAALSPSLLHVGDIVTVEETGVTSVWNGSAWVAASASFIGTLYQEDGSFLPSELSLDFTSGVIAKDLPANQRIDVRLEPVGEEYWLRG